VKASPIQEAAIFAIERPHPNLFIYYVLALLLIPPLLPVLILPAWFRYHTMRYRFTAEGISMSWGILFRREIIVNYARIQDIHLRSNVVERWLGLAKILVQTASGSAGAELTLEGLREFAAIRDFLYERMRGVKEPARVADARPQTAMPPLTGGGSVAELATVLQEVVGELRALRHTLEQRRSETPAPDAPRDA
jgi:putative membrane protein